MKELKLKKCLKCGSLIKVIEDCHCEECGIVCCNQEMKTIDANTTDASVEKHKPTYSVENDKLVVRVNHVMESEHYIEWICLITDNKEEYVYFNHSDEPVAIFDNVNTGTIYSYCNLHGLWKTDIE